MTTHTIIGYDADALIFDPNTGSFSLDPNYTANNGRVRLEITDDDQFFDGDRENDEVGEDANQTAQLYDMDGNSVSSGQIYVEQYAVLQAPDGTQIFIDRIEIGGNKVAYLPSQPLDPNVNYSVVSEGNVDDTNQDPSHDGDDGSGATDTRMTYDQYNDVPCFVAGTFIETKTGPAKIETLKAGDWIATQSHGWQPVTAVLTTKIAGAALRHSPDLLPITLAAKENHSPLCVSPNHRLLYQDWAVQLLFGEDSVLIAAKHLFAPDALADWIADGVTYYHLILPEHAIIQANGVWCESYFVSENDEMIQDAEWAHYKGSDATPLGEIIPHKWTAHRCLKQFEVQTYLAYTNQTDQAGHSTLQQAVSA